MRLALALLALVPLVAWQEQAFEGAPIHYERATTEDPVARLVARLDSGELELEYDAAHGWLPMLLAALDVPQSSQTLVFSKTSFQNRLISPRNPRALYFGDDVYVGYVPGGDVIELSSIDPVQGPIFYSLDQARADGPRIARTDAACLQCHASPATRGWPAHLVRSVHPDADGLPILSSGSFATTPASPLAERWGGWYVTGDLGGQTHLGNRVVEALEGDRRIAPSADAVLALGDRLPAELHLRADSDVVALLVLEHQTFAHNALARASYEGLRALDYQATLNAALGDPPDTLSDSTRRRLDRAAADVVDALLSRDEAPLTAPLRGTSPFATDYAARGPRDPQGRSLFELDLETRLHRYSLSPLVYAPALARLPEPVLRRVATELGRILRGEDVGRSFPHLAPESARAALEILKATHPTLAPLLEPASAPPGAQPKDG